MNNSFRKRKRNYGDSNNKKVFDQDGDEGTNITETIVATSSSTSPYTTGTTTRQKQKQRTNQVSQNLLFRDKIVVVTTLQQQQESSDSNSTLLNDETTNEDAPPDTTNNDINGELTIGNTYKSVASFVQQQLGATITHQVHSRVYCVIASPQAIQEPTQRIRKAWKRNIPVVTTQYIYDCVQQQNIIPIPTVNEMPNKYRILPSSSASKSSSTTKKTLSTPSEPVNHDDNVDTPERIIDLGCCCICHDNDNTTNDPCEWCIDCSYTKKLP